MSSLPPPPPPGSLPPAPPLRAAELPFRRVGSLARAMVILLVISAAVQVVLLPVLVAVRGKAADFVDGRISEDTFEESYAVQAGLQSLQGGLQIALVVLTMIWMFRLAQNQQRLGRPGSRWTPGWAVGGWFVPPGAVYAVPWLMFRELWKGSDPQNRPGDPAWTTRAVSPLLQVWWVLYGFVPLIGLVAFARVGVGSFRLDSLLDEAERIDDYFVVQFGLGVVAVVTHAVYAKIVHDLTARQKLLTGEG